EMRKAIAAVLAALAVGAAAGRAERAGAGQRQEPAREAPLHRGGYLNAYIALLKSDLKSRKAGFIREGLRLNEKETADFWPIYQSYEADLKRVDDARRQVIQDFMDNYDGMTDDRAKEMIRKLLAMEGQRVAVKKAYLKRFQKVLPGKTLARFLQLEYRFGLLIDLKNTAEIPLIE
ncbi:MAG TPA: hypothetical protein VNZ44_18715, partial [Pyrinomonadaceae bacterium]|nr:hypothetical protein [Pyrinomonadaceae bacterium]